MTEEDQHEYRANCDCLRCEKYRAKHGMGLLNPRAATGEAPESRPVSAAQERR